VGGVHKAFSCLQDLRTTISIISYYYAPAEILNNQLKDWTAINFNNQWEK
jgi:hypothetical protein